MSESAVRDKPLLGYGLARNRRSPKCPPEPRPSGVHPEEGEVEQGGVAFRLRYQGVTMGNGRPVGEGRCWAFLYQYAGGGTGIKRLGA